MEPFNVNLSVEFRVRKVAGVMVSPRLPGNIAAQDSGTNHVKLLALRWVLPAESTPFSSTTLVPSPLASTVMVAGEGKSSIQLRDGGRNHSDRRGSLEFNETLILRHSEATSLTSFARTS